jgi:hypothetical protein
MGLGVTEKDLREVFDLVIGKWVNVLTQDASLVSQMPSSVAIERKAVLGGRAKLHLVLRVPHGFALKIGRILACGSDEEVVTEDVVSELLNIYCGHLKNRVWRSEEPFSVHLPEKSVIKEWPGMRPDVVCFMMAGGYPVEIMLWDSTSKVDPPP